ncbi:MAG: hypothetical protein ACKO0Z_22145 [Betaproteobacteria bacterium]
MKIPSNESIELDDVSEYCECYPVYIDTVKGNDYSLGENEERMVLCATNQGGFDGVAIDLLELVAWLKKNKPELLS